MNSGDSIFARIKPAATPCVTEKEKWFTWSPRFRRAITQAKEEIGPVVPGLKAITGFLEYNNTYDLHGSKKGIRSALDVFKPFAIDLYNLEVDDGIFLFDRLIDEKISGSDLGLTLTLLRKSIVNTMGGQMEALYTPLTESTKGDFPLHCDLYIPTRLFNIYEDVARDGSGASIFLPMDVFNERVLSRLDTMPIRIRRKLCSLLGARSAKDRYSIFFDLINSPMNPWFRQLKRLMNPLAFKHKFEIGQGYLLHDRRWLHGRTKPNGHFTIKRVHRLVYNSKA